MKMFCLVDLHSIFYFQNKKNSSNSSCEVELIERLQNLLVELEPWELDFIKSSRANREKMYKEYTSFINR